VDSGVPLEESPTSVMIMAPAALQEHTVTSGALKVQLPTEVAGPHQFVDLHSSIPRAWATPPLAPKSSSKMGPNYLPHFTPLDQPSLAPHGTVDAHRGNSTASTPRGSLLAAKAPRIAPEGRAYICSTSPQASPHSTPPGRRPPDAPSPSGEEEEGVSQSRMWPHLAFGSGTPAVGSRVSGALPSRLSPSRTSASSGFGRRRSTLGGWGTSTGGKRIIRDLASLLNSDVLCGGGSQFSEESARRRAEGLRKIDEMAAAGATIKMSDLTFVRPLGAGGFATVDLYSMAHPDDSGRRYEMALKKLRRRIPGPPMQSYPGGPPVFQLIDVPPSWRTQFQAEAILMRALRHPNVVSSYGSIVLDKPSADSGEQSGDILPDDITFLQEFCDGGSLLHKVQMQEEYDGSLFSRAKRAYTAVEALGWLADVARGMAYLHDDRNGARVTVLHRDLKLENVLLSGGVAKVADFGLSRLLPNGQSGVAPPPGAADVPMSPFPPLAPSNGLDASPPISPPLLPQLAKDMTGETGSYRYMAPEMYQLCAPAPLPGSSGEGAGRSGSPATAYTHKVDVFSFAILATELLTRKRAYADKFMTMEMVVRNVARSGLRPTLPKRWPPPLKALITRCWDAKPELRPEFHEICYVLEAFTEAARAAAADGKANKDQDDGKTSDASMMGADLLLALDPPLPPGGCCLLS
jgi:serine/threonine protein kinase